MLELLITALIWLLTETIVKEIFAALICVLVEIVVKEIFAEIQKHRHRLEKNNESDQ